MDQDMLPAHTPVVIPFSGTDQDTWLRLPVEPRQLPKGPRIGCSRYPSEWTPIMTAIEDAVGQPA
eukprot:6320325-Pyramimonas_sp.AAC.1